MTSAAPHWDDLVTLNQELASLVRAGIPLETGLRQQASAWPSRFSQLADRIALRLSQGDSLLEALRQEGPAVSPAYAAVVEAGLQSGRLPEALEDLAELGMTLQEVRRRVWIAAAYPLIVCCLAYVIFVGFITFGVPIWLQTREALFLPPRFFFGLLAQLHETVPVWGPLIPMAILAVLVTQVLWSGAAASGPWRMFGSGRWIPGVNALYRQLLLAQFSRLLSVLLEHQLPAGLAVRLAADSTGDLRLQTAGRVISQQIEQGTAWKQAVAAATTLPSYLRWMMAVGEQHGALADVMQQAAETYQRRADRWLLWIRSVLPVLLVTCLTGLVVLMYCLGLLLPLQQFWYDLMETNP